MKKFLVGLTAAAAFAIGATPAQAIVISPTNNNPAGTAAIIAALTAGNTGLNITGITIDSNGSGVNSSIGTFTNASGTYGIGSPGVVISSGAVADYGDGPNTSNSNTTSYGTSATAAQAATLTAISGPKSYNDVTEITINFNLDAGFNTVFFNVVFGSEEFPEYQGSNFIDAFGLLVNGVNIAFTGGNPINIDNPSFAAMAGTQLDGVNAPGGNPVMTFGTLLANPTGNNTLTFIIADSGDTILDSTAYIAALGAVNPGNPVPEPASMLLLGAGLAGIGARLRRRKAQQ